MRRRAAAATDRQRLEAHGRLRSADRRGDLADVRRRRLPGTDSDGLERPDLPDERARTAQADLRGADGCDGGRVVARWSEHESIRFLERTARGFLHADAFNLRRLSVQLPCGWDSLLLRSQDGQANLQGAFGDGWRRLYSLAGGVGR